MGLIKGVESIEESFQVEKIILSELQCFIPKCFKTQSLKKSNREMILTAEEALMNFEEVLYHLHSSRND